MPVRKSEAIWEGNLKEGKGKVKTASGTCEGSYSFSSRFEDGRGTNPEELLGAAHAGCFSMALAHMLSEAGYKPEKVHTTASVSIDRESGGFRITSITLENESDVPGIDEKTFMEKAESAKKDCPVSRALAGTDIRLNARLLKKAGARG
jgi:osmotically inducible protein OsmC